MTEKEAKELTIEVWTYIAEHPEISGKNELPEELYSKIKNLEAGCPLCELFLKSGCTGCPLDAARNRCALYSSFYSLWRCAETRGERSAAAWGIVNIVKEWKI
jgi:hypothetical protein